MSSPTPPGYTGRPSSNISGGVKTIVDRVNKKWAKSRTVSMAPTPSSGDGGGSSSYRNSSMAAATFALEEQSYLVQLMLEIEHNTGAVELCQSILGDFQRTARTYYSQMSNLHQARTAISNADTEGVRMLQERVMVVLTKQRMLDIEIKYLENKINLFQRRNRAFDEFNERLITLYSSSWPKSSIKKSQISQDSFERNIDEIYNQLHKADMTLERYKLLKALLTQGEKALRAAGKFAEGFKEENGSLSPGIKSRLNNKYLDAMRMCTVQADVAMKQAKFVLPSLFKDYLNVEIFQDGWLSSVFRSDRIEDANQHLKTFSTHHTALKPIIEQSKELIKNQSELTHALRTRYHDALLSKENAQRKTLYDFVLPSTMAAYLEDPSGTRGKESGRDLLYFRMDSLEMKLDKILYNADVHASKSKSRSGSGSTEENEVGNGNEANLDAEEDLVATTNRIMMNNPKRQTFIDDSSHREADGEPTSSNISRPVPVSTTNTALSSSYPHPATSSRAPSPLNSLSNSRAASPGFAGIGARFSSDGSITFASMSTFDSAPIPPVAISNTPATPISPSESGPSTGPRFAAPKPIRASSRGHFKSYSTSTPAVRGTSGANLGTSSSNPPRRPSSRPPNLFDSEDNTKVDGVVSPLPGAIAAKTPGPSLLSSPSPAHTSSSLTPSPAASASSSPAQSRSQSASPAHSLDNSRSRSSLGMDSNASQTRGETEASRPRIQDGVPRMRSPSPLRPLRPSQPAPVPSSSTLPLTIPSPPMSTSVRRSPSPLPIPPSIAPVVQSRTPSPSTRPMRALPIPGQNWSQRSNSDEQGQEQGQGQGQGVLPIGRPPPLPSKPPGYSAVPHLDRPTQSPRSPSPPGEVAISGSIVGLGRDSPAPDTPSSASSLSVYSHMIDQSKDYEEGDERDDKTDNVIPRDEAKPEAQAQAEPEVETEVKGELAEVGKAKAEGETGAEPAAVKSLRSAPSFPPPSPPPLLPPLSKLTSTVQSSSTRSVTPPPYMFSSPPPPRPAFTNNLSPLGSRAQAATTSTPNLTTTTMTTTTTTSTTRAAPPHGILKHISSQSTISTSRSTATVPETAGTAELPPRKQSSLEEWGTVKVGTAPSTNTKAKFKSMFNRLRGEGHSSHGGGSGHGDTARNNATRGVKPNRPDSGSSSYSAGSGSGVTSPAMAAAIAAGFISPPGAHGQGQASQSQLRPQSQSQLQPQLQIQRSRSPRFVDNVEIIPRPEVDSYPYSSDEDEGDAAEQPPSPSKGNSILRSDGQTEEDDDDDDDDDEEEKKETRVKGKMGEGRAIDGRVLDDEDNMGDYYYVESPVRHHQRQSQTVVDQTGQPRERGWAERYHGQDNRASSSSGRESYVPSGSRRLSPSPSRNSNINEAVRRREIDSTGAAMDNRRNSIDKYKTFYDDMLLKPAAPPLTSRNPQRPRPAAPPPPPPPPPLSINTMSTSNRVSNLSPPKYTSSPPQIQGPLRYIPTRPPPPKPVQREP